jgi:hypothetical protein
MRIYRILTNLRYRKRTIPPGQLEALELTVEQEAALKRAGAVGDVEAPPLGIVPGFERRAARLKRAGVEDGLQLLEADAAELAKEAKVTRNTILKWQEEVRKFLTGG